MLICYSHLLHMLPTYFCLLIKKEFEQISFLDYRMWRQTQMFPRYSLGGSGHS